MRQVDDSPEEAAFRRALENLRWRGCDAADIALLRSRIAGTTPDLSVERPGFRDVSIITALNKDKDQINATNSARFAAETGQTLEHFYSIDRLNGSEPKRPDPKKKRRIYSTAKSISKAAQNGLWNQPPSTSEQIPGRLSLCIGMPVIIRYNEATELCITRGQEARVVGWSALKYPKWPGRKYLDVLYVQLVNPPHTVKLPHLPKNVVPLTRNSESIEAQLPNDLYMRISRAQIPVLPNFSMTDYSSQGKTRKWNVVDIKECKSFHGVYTCLSRGTSLARTLILRDFSNDLLCGDIDGALRQEYRELNHLTVITDLLYQGRLPASIIQPTRWETIRLYKAWKKTAGRDVDDAPIFDEEDTISPPKDNIHYEIETMHAMSKRKERELNAKEPQKKRRKVTHAEPILANATWASPPGPIWDSADWSCSYDALTFILHWLWVSDRVKWTRIFEAYSSAMSAMARGFASMAQKDPEIELTEVRDQWREVLRATHPGNHPAGMEGADIMALTENVLGFRFMGTRIKTSCRDCSNKTIENAVNRPLTIGPFCSVRRAASIQEFVDESFHPLRVCSFCTGNVFVNHKKSEIIAFEVVEAGDVVLNSRVNIGNWGLYRLAGVVYYGDYHFVSRVITRENKVYAHDSIEGGGSTYEGTLETSLPLEALATLNGRTASLAFYALADRVVAHNHSDTESD
ncbi:hypothetical protein DFP72DRAFT_825122 [Ephemerocybe angulata]|uniref:Uncharacterized protein n=1 Tax=Ephemerocybe angulata TaxID=980116 RepID=A0A8H6LXL0_9AGAR|nr:hypothetical protein DFP72DRAFT_825122 [Tulosesus angulatus]